MTSPDAVPQTPSGAPRNETDAVLAECISLVLDAVLDVLPRYVGRQEAVRIVQEVRAVIEQEFRALLAEEEPSP